MNRQLKPFMISEEEVESYRFTKAQISAYESLKKAIKRCEKSGLSLFGKQDSLVAYPSKMHMNQMLSVGGGINKKILAPYLDGAYISDSGADDYEYILDKYIK